MEEFKFDPVDGWEDVSEFPTTPDDETATRTLFQKLYNQIRDFINTKIVAGHNAHLADIVNYGQFKLSATQNINVADGAQINFDTVEKENKDYYILATGDNAGKIKILKDGVYDIELQIRLLNVTLTDFKGMSSQVMHNGVSKANASMAFKANNTFISNRAYTKVSALSVVCKANDLISAFIVTNTTDTVSIEGTGTIQTYLRIRKVG